MPPASPIRLRRAPERLLVWQRTLHSLVTRPLDSRGRTSRAPLDGVAAPRLARSLVKPSATLEPLERIEIYNRMYWARVLDSLAEDFPGLRALLGEERFTELSCRYLAAHPSRRPSLRDLGAQLPGFVRHHPRLIGSHAGAATDLARCEWAQIIAFDAAQLQPLNATDLTSARPSRLRVRLQPGITLLQLNHAVDEFWHAIKRGGSFRSDASNTRLIRPTSFAPTADGVRPPLRGRPLPEGQGGTTRRLVRRVDEPRLAFTPRRPPGITEAPRASHRHGPFACSFRFPL
jgi:hypothetical protein